jgi:predicted acyl esterase
LKNIKDNNGKVGQYGTSYPGFYTAVGILAQHPALVASSPQAPISDFWNDDFLHNGRFMLAISELSLFSEFRKQNLKIKLGIWIL